MAEGVRAYDVLARHYDRLLAVPYRRWIEFIAARARNLSASQPRLVDLGCGSGTVAVGLARLGYAVAGVDRSSEMLAVAARRAREANVAVDWYQQDFARFPLEADLVCCTCDGFNHILRPARLVAVLARIRRQLAPRGELVFDVNSEYKYRQILADKSFHFQYPDLSVVWDNFYRAPYNQAQLTLFELSGKRFARSLVAINQRCYPLHSLLYYLYHTGFDVVGVYNDYRPGAIARAKRLTIVARKGRRR